MTLHRLHSNTTHSPTRFTRTCWRGIGSFIPPYVINSSKANTISKAWSTTASSFIDPAYSGTTTNHHIHKYTLFANKCKVSKSSIILLDFVVTTRTIRFSSGWYTYLLFIFTTLQTTSSCLLLQMYVAYLLLLTVWETQPEFPIHYNPLTTHSLQHAYGSCSHIV